MTEETEYSKKARKEAREQSMREALKMEDYFRNKELDLQLNLFAQHLLLNNIKLNDSNQIAQVVIDYLNPPSKEIIESKSDKHCDHYFARKTDGKLMPCEFCGKNLSKN